ncbi:MAG: hypothetical protein AB1921_00350 [Thermodesulfobacteriota bacterium]
MPTVSQTIAGAMPGPPEAAADPGRVRRDMEKARFLVRLCAPFYLVFICSLRSYLETVPFAGVLEPSLYRSAHQVLWYINALLTGLLFFHLITRVPLRRLLWFFYAMTVLLLPVAYVWLTGQKLFLEYHHGEPWKILADIFTFVVTAPHNHPVILDGGVAMAGLGVMAFFYTRRPWRGVLMSLAIFSAVNFFAVLWLGPNDLPQSVMSVPSSMTLQPFLASLHILVTTVIVTVWVAAAGLFSKDARAWALSAAAGALAWVVFAVYSLHSGYFTAAFDATVCGLVAFSCVTLAVRILFRAAGTRGSPYAAAIFTALLAVQLLILGPVFLKEQERFTYPVSAYTWGLTREPFSEIRLDAPRVDSGLRLPRPESGRSGAPPPEGGRQ